MELDSIAELSRQGAPQLSLKLIERYQPNFLDHAEAWYDWEGRRLQILESRQDWAGIIERYQTYPEGIDTVFSRWARELLVKSYLELEQAHTARRHLRHLIWATQIEDAEALKRYRDLVIRSFMAEAAVEAAQLSMFRYQQDYPRLDPRMQLLRAEILLFAKRYEEAQGILAGIKSEESKVLSLLAQLRQSNSLTDEEQAELRRMASQINLPRRVRYLAWAVQAELAQIENQKTATILAQERALSLESGLHSLPFIRTGAEQLWQEYRARALAMGNRKQLLQGDDGAWLELADGLVKQEPLDARSLYAYLALDAAAESNRTLAHERLIDQVLLLQEGEQILERLYRPLFQGQGADRLPSRIRYFFADRALSRGDVELASHYLAKLDTAPDGEDDIAWNQRRARILIMAGQTAEGIAILRGQLNSDVALKGKVLDRFMQVVFDLQTVKEHEVAIELFTSLLAQNSNLRLRRELHFWIADSYRELEQPELATAHYLKSAALSGGGEGQLWAQSAKYQAAQALAEAGLYDDARTLYRQLLRATEDTERKAVLRQEMQDLRLKQVHPGVDG
ncbi:MAG: hypothetical protein HUJ29_12240 [Gammaproteobacteria bacterium]|nr:hypothetical protein [Gammaproteobacteria bacterium]